MTDTVTIPGTSRRLKEEEKDEVKKQPPYHVILHNDDDHTFDYVIEMLKKLFGHPAPKGYLLAVKVHTEGRVVVDTTSRERAELKRDQIHAYGADHRLPRCKGSMSATIEPAE
jgi:ATP-dependent Clp protease adaptor protein ClpS